MPWLLITDVGFHQDQRIHIKTTLGRFKHLPRSEALHRIPHGFRKKSCTGIFIQLCYTAGNEQLSRESKIFLLQIFKNAKKNKYLFLPCTSKPSAQHLVILLPRALPGTSFPLRPVAHHGRFLLATAIPGGSVSSNKGVCESISPQGKAEKNECFLLPKALDFGLVCCKFL